MLEKLRIKITILATLIVTACAYLYKIDFLKACYTIVLTIVIFYFLGGFIEIFLKNQLDKIEEEKKEKEADLLEENTNLEEELEDNSDNSELQENNL